MSDTVDGNKERPVCNNCGGQLDILAQYGELKGICPNPECDVVIELGATPEW